jgi:hypothetical protein
MGVVVGVVSIIITSTCRSPSACFSSTICSRVLYAVAAWSRSCSRPSCAERDGMIRSVLTLGYHIRAGVR